MWTQHKRGLKQASCEIWIGTLFRSPDTDRGYSHIHVVPYVSLERIIVSKQQLHISNLQFIYSQFANTEVNLLST